jgi:hypothetical protein
MFCLVFPSGFGVLTLVGGVRAQGLLLIGAFALFAVFRHSEWVSFAGVGSLSDLLEQAKLSVNEPATRRRSKLNCISPL